MKTLSSRFITAPLAAAVLSLCSVGVANAANINFIEGLTESDPILIQHDAANWLGFQVATNSPEFAQVTGTFVTNSTPGQAGSSVAYMLEPVGTNKISDRITMVWNVDASSIAHVNITFESDNESNNLGFLTTGFGLYENGQSQLLNDFFNAPIPLNLTISAQSDVEAVPIPAALFFVGPALAGLFGWNLRKSGKMAVLTAEPSIQTC